MEAEENHYRSVALKFSLVFATLGLFSALLILALFGATGVIVDISGSIITGVIALYIAAAGFGLVAGNLIYWLKGRGIGVWLTGIGLAWSCLVISALAGSSVEFLSSSRNWMDFGDYIIKPLIWVMLVGIIPAFILGVLYAATVKKFLK